MMDDQNIENLSALQSLVTVNLVKTWRVYSKVEIYIKPVHTKKGKRQVVTENAAIIAFLYVFGLNTTVMFDFRRARFLDFLELGV